MARAATTRRPAADAKREAILAAAMQLFSRYGFRRTSIDDIAREAGIAKGTVYLYVDSKEALFRALAQSLLDRVLENAATAAAQPGPVAERLFAILDAKFGFFHELLHGSPHAGEILDSSGKVCADVFARGDVAYLTILTKTIAAAARKGALAPRRHDLSAEDAARLLLAGAHGVDADPARRLTAAEHRTRLRALVRVIVDGLGPR